MIELVDLDGTWSGYYEQIGRRFPITAYLRQDGPRLTGTMVDGQPDVDYPFAAVAEHHGLPEGVEERIVQKLRAGDPELPDAPLRLVFRLPTESILEGRVSARVVTFRKSYQGEQTIGKRIGDRKWVGVKRPRVVEYRGVLDDGGREIAGRWRIRLPLWVRLLTTLRDEGEFLLRRA